MLQTLGIQLLRNFGCIAVNAIAISPASLWLLGDGLQNKNSAWKSGHRSISALMTAFGIEIRLRLCVCEFWQALSSLVNQIMQHPENCWFGYGRFEEQVNPFNSRDYP